MARFGRACECLLVPGRPGQGSHRRRPTANPPSFDTLSDKRSPGELHYPAYSGAQIHWCAERLAHCRFGAAAAQTPAEHGSDCEVSREGPPNDCFESLGRLGVVVHRSRSGSRAPHAGAVHQVEQANRRSVDVARGRLVCTCLVQGLLMTLEKAAWMAGPPASRLPRSRFGLPSPGWSA